MLNSRIHKSKNKIYYNFYFLRILLIVFILPLTFIFSSFALSGCNSNNENVVDLVIFMGQSNMAGRGDYKEATKVKKGHGYEFRAVSDPTKLYDIGDKPFGINENRGDIYEDTKTGSMVPAIMSSYYKKTGVPIVGVSSSKGGTGIEFWMPGSNAMKESVKRYKLAKEFLENNGYTIRRQFMVWCQGETDGGKGMESDVYKTKLIEVFAEMKDVGIEKCMVVRIGNHRDNPTLYDKIILAQTKLCMENDDFVLVSAKLASMAEDGLMKDEYHYVQKGYNIVGKDVGKNMAYFVKKNEKPSFYDPEYKKDYPFEI